jgi:hypothetical protein
MKKFFEFGAELEFFVKIAMSCVFFQWFFAFLLQDIETHFMTNVVLFWLISLASFYGIGFFIEKVIKKNDTLRKRLTARVVQVKKQVYPALTVKEFLVSSVKTFIAGAHSHFPGTKVIACSRRFSAQINNKHFSA